MELFQENKDILLKVGQTILEKWHLCNIHHFKESKDICTNLDLKADQMIISHLQKKYPDYNILSEESGLHDKNSAYTWVVDPIDGSKNFLNRLPFFNITIALQHNQEIIFGIIYSPATHEFYYAEKNKGSHWMAVANNFTLDPEKHELLKISTESELKKATMHTEFPTKHKNPDPQHNITTVNKFFDHCYRLRSIGSGALALAYTARASYDGYIDFSRTTNIWDVAAGIILVEEAGGVVSDFNGLPISSSTNSIIASNKFLHHEILKLLQA